MDYKLGIYMFFRCFIVLMFLFISTSFASSKTEIETPKEYTAWLEELKKEMISKGISKETIEKAYKKDYYHPEPEVVSLDRKQPEFVLTTTEYLNRLINTQRVITARKEYKLIKKEYAKIEENYGVPLEYLISFWALESNFGTRFGGFEIIESLTHLSYDKRRSNFFKNELYQALKIMDLYGFEPEDMTGSWAGAMGHFQFMPSTFNAYAVDYDKDGKIDIWNNFGDALASASNYLSKLSWRKNQPWGQEIKFTYKFDYINTGLQTTKTVEEWNRLGVRDLEYKSLSLDENMKASIILPEGRKGKGYIVFDNFKKIMIWNKAENYALAISKLSDYAKTEGAWKPEDENLAVKIKTADIILVQNFINKQKIDKIDSDGTFGSKTKLAIKKLQKKALIPADGYPDYRLLNKIRKFDKKIGFAVPVQPQKPEYKKLSK